MTRNDGFDIGGGGWLAMAAIFGMIAVCWMAMGCSFHWHFGEQIYPNCPQQAEDVSSNGASNDAFDDWLKG